MAKKKAPKAPAESETTVEEIMNQEETPVVDSFDSPESSNITGASYNSETKTLQVTFHLRKAGKGRSNVYEYSKDNAGKPMPESVWHGFKSAISKGRYFTSEILPHYKGTAISE